MLGSTTFDVVIFGLVISITMCIYLGPRGDIFRILGLNSIIQGASIIGQNQDVLLLPFTNFNLPFFILSLNLTLLEILQNS